MRSSLPHMSCFFFPLILLFRRVVTVREGRHGFNWLTRFVFFCRSTLIMPVRFWCRFLIVRDAGRLAGLFFNSKVARIVFANFVSFCERWRRQEDWSCAPCRWIGRWRDDPNHLGEDQGDSDFPLLEGEIFINEEILALPKMLWRAPNTRCSFWDLSQEIYKFIIGLIIKFVFW